MKILHVIPSISSLRGGPSTAVLAMVKALRQQGVDAAILTTNDHGPGLHPDLPVGRWIEHQGVPVLAFQRWNPPLRPLREFAVSPGLSSWLAGHIHRFQLLHVHALFSYPSTSAMAQARWAGVPYILRSIGQLSPWSLAQSAARKRWMLRLIERRNLSGAASLHFTSTSERDEAAALGLPTAPLVIPLGVSLPPPSPTRVVNNPCGDIRFLFLSRLHPKKQLDRLLEACALLRSWHPEANWQLQIAGSGDPAYVEALQRRAGQLGISDRCRWLGFVEGEAKWRLLQEADWFVLPSASENFGIAVVEALAAGTPVIVSPQVAVAETIVAAGAGLLCESSPGPLAEILGHALRQPTTTMRIAARNLVRDHYSWPTVASQLVSAYSRLITIPTLP